ncbi:MAG: Ig-like domain-containing protein [Nanoarchaeota archaeon]|nr:Ig-like domain-containing protein [Nanoarchaeota archaeon]
MIIYAVMTSAVDPVVDMDPTQVYETTTHTFNLTINNYNGNYEIKSVKVLTTRLEVLSLADYLGWSENYTTSFAHWYDGSLATNVLLALFELSAKAAQVDDNETDALQVILIDDEGNNYEYYIPILIVNDDSAPILSNNHPEDGDHIKEGVSDELFSIDAVDPETGVSKVSVEWTICDEDNVTPQDYETELDNEEGTDTYTKRIDLSEYENEDTVCFAFEGESNGGEIAREEGKVRIDGEAPIVTLNYPDDEALINAESEFLFTATDNLAEVLTCIFYNDAVQVSELSVDNGVQATVPAVDAEEGVHDWKVTCRDKAGWETESEERMYILDKTPPVINLTSPENNSIISFMTLINFEVSDNYQLQQVYYVLNGTRYDVNTPFNINPFDWPEGPTTVQVVAQDAAGNVRVGEYVFTVDRTAPTIELLSPLNESDVHVTFEFDSEDNYDTTLLCALVVDDETRMSGTFNTNETGTFFDRLTLGNHTWRIECTDDANNTGFSGIEELTVIDLSGPDMTFNHPTTYFRGDTILFNVTITDPSGVEDVDATLEMPDSDIMEVFLLERDGYYVRDMVTDTSFLTGPYVLDVYATDTLGHPTRNQSEILVTYRYIVDMTLSVSPITIGNAVTISGSVAMDNGSLIPEDSVTLQIGDEEVDVALDENKTFVYTFTPGATGTYTIVAKITPDNGIEFNDTETLVVNEVQGNDDDGGNGGSSGTRNHEPSTTSSGSCSADWECGEWSDCINSNKQRTCRQNNCGDTSATKTERRACHEPKEEPTETTQELEPEQPRVTSNKLAVNDTQQDEQTDEESVIIEDDKGNGLFGRIGRAFGFLTGAGAGISLFIVVLIALGLMGTLFLTGWRKTPKTSGSIKSDALFGDYLNRRNR